MKPILLTAILFLLFQKTFAQETYHYTFSVENVYDLPTAKDVRDPLRIKFDCRADFNDDTDLFDFISSVNVTKEELESMLISYGYTLTTFTKVNVDQEEEPSETINE